MGLRVRISPAGGGPPVVICDSPDPLPTFNFTLNGRRVLQIQDLFRAAYVSIFPRNNRANRISFETVRNTDAGGKAFKGNVDSLLFALDQNEDVPVTGTVEFLMSDANATGTRWMAGGAIETIDLVKYIGPSLFLKYSLVGGKFLKSNPSQA